MSPTSSMRSNIPELVGLSDNDVVKQPFAITQHFEINSAQRKRNGGHKIRNPLGSNPALTTMLPTEIIIGDPVLYRYIDVTTDNHLIEQRRKI